MISISIGQVKRHHRQVTSGQVEIVSCDNHRPLAVGTRVVLTQGELTGSTGRVREIIPRYALVGPGNCDRDDQSVSSPAHLIAWLDWEAVIVDLDIGGTVITGSAQRI